MKPGEDRTHIAFLSTSFAQAFATHFYEWDVSGHAPFLQTPEGVSTGGGARARQPLVLRPIDGGAKLPIGWVDVHKKECRLRSYGCLLELHRKRFQSVAFGIDAAAYERFVTEARTFFGKRQMKVELEEHVADNVPQSIKRPPQVNPLRELWETYRAEMIVAAVSTLLALFLVAYLLLR